MNESVETARLSPHSGDAAPSDAAASSGAQVGVPRPHESAHLHVAGEAPYTDDLPEVVGTLHIALGLSPVAHGRLTGLALDRLRTLPGVVAVLTGADFPGPNDCGAIVHDEPILASIAFRDDGSCDGELRYLGQPVVAVVADTRDAARRRRPATS
jgi:xanthine dehydrogenase large subunit